MLPPKRSTRTTFRDGSADPILDAHSKVNDIQEQYITVIGSSPSITPRQLRDITSRAISPSLNTQGDCTPSQKKARRKLSTPQRLALEELSTLGLNPSLEARRTVAEENGLELKVVSVWFQNKRRPVSSKCEESTIIFQHIESGKAEQGARRVLADINGSANNQAIASSKNKCIIEEAPTSASDYMPSSSPPSKAIYEQVDIKTPSGLWDFLPSSSPGPPAESYFSDDGTQREAISEAPVQRKKRHSLEWACEKDERTTKRARKSEEHVLQKRTCIPPTSSVRPQHQRQRTDRKPRRPSPRTLSRVAPVPKPRSHSHGSLGHRGNSICCTEKEIMDVALALIQLKGQDGRVRKARRSI